MSRIPAERILLIQFRKIGDVLLNTPMVRALRQHYPQSYIAYCAEPGPAGVLKGNPMLDDILLYPRPATLRDAWRFIRRIREYGFDLVIDIMGNPRSALLSWMSGARHRVAFARWPRSLCYTMLVDHHHEFQGYIIKKWLRLLEPLGIHASDVSTTMTYTPQDRGLVDHFLKENGVRPDDLLICIDPTKRPVTGQWPSQRFSKLADLLIEKLGARVCLLWRPGGKDYVTSIAAATRSKPILNPPWELFPGGSPASSRRFVCRVRFWPRTYRHQPTNPHGHHIWLSARYQLASSRAAAPRSDARFAVSTMPSKTMRSAT